jgi:hypothetical protein
MQEDKFAGNSQDLGARYGLQYLYASIHMIIYL